MATYTLYASALPSPYVLNNLTGAFVPETIGNADYAAYQTWVELGGTPDVGDIPGTPAITDNYSFWRRFTNAEQANMMASAQTNPQVAIGWVWILAAGQVTLGGTQLAQFMASLVVQGDITQARSLAIQTP